jgi:hypothetical protein
MGVLEILATLDSEIAKLEQARGALIGGATQSSKKAAGKSKKVAGVAAVATKPTKKRKLTPEGRRRIAEAVKRRWAAQTAAAAK